MQKEINENGIRLILKEGVFYNPKMKINRDFVTTALKILKPKSYLDGHSASGAKAIRAGIEADIEEITTVDLSKKACENIELNAEIHKLNLKIIQEDLKLHLMKNNYEFIELDPFGSPAPYICSCAESFSRRKNGYLSVTATDTAVLCGAEYKACQRIYGSTPMKREIVHDIGLRILIKYIHQHFALHNLAITPLLSISNRHYLKIFLKVERNAKKVDENNKKIGYLFYCENCGCRNFAKVGDKDECKICKNKMKVIGPIWIGKIHEREFVGKMKDKLEERYDDYKEEKKILENIYKEADFEGMVYDLDKTLKGRERLPKTKEVIERISKEGRAVETHYSTRIIKTDIGCEKLKKII